MSVLVIPFQNTSQKFSCDLADRTLTFRTYYNKIMDAWCFDLSDSKGNIFTKSNPIVTGTNMLAQMDYKDLKGVFVTLTAGDKDMTPTRKSLGNESKFYFVSVDELAGG